MIKLDIDLRLIEELKNINWCSNIGKNSNIKYLYPVNEKIIPHIKKTSNDILPIYIKQINNYKEFIASIKGINWESNTLEYKNVLSIYLNDKYNIEYQEWNKIVKKANMYFDVQIKPTIRLKYILDEDKDSVITDIRSNIIGIIIENAYRKCKKESYFKYLILELYKKGQIPCGCENEEFPLNKLFIY